MRTKFTLLTTNAVASTVPNWPRYVTNDWFVNDTEEEILDKIKKFQLTPDTNWTFLDRLHFTKNMWTLEYQQLYTQRITNSAESSDCQHRLEAQRRSLQFHNGVNPEPVILSWKGIGYELVEGWHRTVTHFSVYPEGYYGPAWIADGLGDKVINLVKY